MAGTSPAMTTLGALQLQHALGIAVGDERFLGRAEREVVEEIDPKLVRLIRPVDREKDAVDAEHIAGALERRGREIAAGRDDDILAHHLGDGLLAAAPLERERGVILGAVEKEGNAFAQMAEDEGKARKGVEEPGE